MSVSENRKFSGHLIFDKNSIFFLGGGGVFFTPINKNFVFLKKKKYFSFFFGKLFSKCFFFRKTISKKKEKYFFSKKKKFLFIGVKTFSSPKQIVFVKNYVSAKLSVFKNGHFQLFPLNRHWSADFSLPPRYYYEFV